MTPEADSTILVPFLVGDFRIGRNREGDAPAEPFTGVAGDTLLDGMLAEWLSWNTRRGV